MNFVNHTYFLKCYALKFALSDLSQPKKITNNFQLADLFCHGKCSEVIVSLLHYHKNTSWHFA